MNRLHLVVAILLMQSSISSGAQVVVPDDTPANRNNSMPFNLEPFSIPSARFQQVYNASSFAPLSDKLSITQLAFQPLGTSAGAATISNIKINLSTTSKSADGLSSTFSDNLGSDTTQVFNGPLTLSRTIGGFNSVVNLQTPFVYDPDQGNLLLEVFNYTGEETIVFNAEVIATDTSSRVFSFDAQAASGETDSVGLITRITYTAIPEPSSTALAAFAAVQIGWLFRRRTR